MLSKCSANGEQRSRLGLPRREEVVRYEGWVDWEDDAAWDYGRMKALSGQLSDWEPLFLFWRRLILLVASHLRISVIPASRVKNHWFRRRSPATGLYLSPLSIPQVLHEMHAAGDILLLGEDLPLVDLSTGSDTSTIARLSGILSRFARAIGAFPSPSLLDDHARDHILVIKPVLQVFYYEKTSSGQQEYGSALELNGMNPFSVIPIQIWSHFLMHICNKIEF